jgi:hypothetical protein
VILTSVSAPTFNEIKGGLLSLFVFVAWLVAATGWVRALAVIWLAYPAFLAWRAVHRGSRL